MKHMKALIDAYQIFLWINFDNAADLVESYPTHYEALHFNGNEVLKMRKDKDSAWMEALYAVAKAFSEFINGHQELLKWGSGDASGAAAFFA